MNPTLYPFEDFLRAKGVLRTALIEHPEPFALLTGDTGSGKTALLRELRTELDRARPTVVLHYESRRLANLEALPPIGSNMLTPSGLMLPPAAMARNTRIVPPARPMIVAISIL